jgi:hypothetical protein
VISADTGADRMLSQLWDIELIKRLKARYCRCVDERDWAGLRSLFTDDAAFESDALVNVSGPDEFVRQASAIVGDRTSVHQVHSPDIVLTGSYTASGVWSEDDYVEVLGSEGPIGVHAYGYYREHYRRDSSGEWRICHWSLSRLRTVRVPLPETPPFRFVNPT